MRTFLLAGLVVWVLSACATSMPFKEPVLGPLANTDPQAVIDRFRSAAPDEFRLVSTIVFDYHWFTVSGIGYVEIDRVGGRYKVVCMNQLGVKLFEFEGDRNGLVRQYAIEPLARAGNVAEAVGKDIQRIYLDLTPSSVSRRRSGKNTLIVRERAGEGSIDYEFAGPDGNLLKKTYREDHRAVWRVSYYDYQEKNGKLYPAGIIFANYRYGYRLIVRQREIRD